MYDDYNELILFTLKELKLSRYRDEYYDAGLIGFTLALKTYNPSLGFTRSTYFIKCIKNEIIKAFKYNMRQKNILNFTSVSLEAEVGDEAELLDFISDPNVNVCEEALKNIDRENLNYCIEHCLRDEDKDCLKLCYGQGMSFRQIAKIKNVSAQMIGARVRRAIRILKDNIEYVEYLKRKNGDNDE